MSIHDQAIVDHLNSKIGLDSDRIKRIFDTLNYPNIDLKLLHLFLTKGFQHWMDYYGRIISPRLAEPIFDRLDKAIRNLFIEKFGLIEFLEGNHLPEWNDILKLKFNQFIFPIDKGGFGFRPQAIVSKMAFAASLAATATELLRTITDLTPDGADVEGPARLRDDYAYLRDYLIRHAPKLTDATFVKVSVEIDALNIKILPTTL